MANDKAQKGNLPTSVMELRHIVVPIWKFVKEKVPPSTKKSLDMMFKLERSEMSEGGSASEGKRIKRGSDYKSRAFTFCVRRKFPGSDFEVKHHFSLNTLNTLATSPRNIQ